jgi:hypothetical protein
VKRNWEELLKNPHLRPKGQRLSGSVAEAQGSRGSNPGDRPSRPSSSLARVGIIDESARTFNPKERRIAEVLASEGKDVKALPEGTIPNERSADALVAGRPTEFKSLDPGASSGTIKNTVNQSLKGGGQARDIIVDARACRSSTNGS